MSNVVDMAAWLKSVHRELRPGTPQSVVLRRRYATDAADLWDALTDPARIERWFARVEGKLAAGETIVLHDTGAPLSWTSAIRTCEAPTRFVMTWRFNGEQMPGFEHDDSTDEVEVRLQPDGDGTVLEVEHRSMDPGTWARGAGMGWENFVMHLAGHLEDMNVDPLFESGEVWGHFQGAWAEV